MCAKNKHSSYVINRRQKDFEQFADEKIVN